MRHSPDPYEIALSRRRFLRTTTLAAATLGMESFACERAVAGQGIPSAGKPGKLTLWYDRPAETWMTEALPIGNGPLGAMLFGGTDEERIQFNEISLWSGDRMAVEGRVLGESNEEEEQNLGAHQAFGDVFIHLGHDFSKVTDYRRELDIDRAVHQVSYVFDGTRYQRTAFASHPAGVIVIHLSADKPGACSGRVRLTDMHAARISAGGNRLAAVGKLSNGFEYEAQLLVLHDQGAVAVAKDGASSGLTFEKCDHVTLILGAGTNFLQDHTKEWLGEHPHAAVTQRVDAAAGWRFDDLLSAHVAAHQALFRRFFIDLGATAPELAAKTTLARLQAYAKDKTADPVLEALFCQFGRYLLISCSRPGSLPANLQGNWNDSNQPAWAGDYHSNINLEMNYWPAEPASYTITPTLYPNVFTASGFTNPVSVTSNPVGKNFTATALPTITINVTDPIANEGAIPGTGTIRLERTGSTASALAVQIFNTNTGTATMGTDYSLSPAATASTTTEGGSGTSQYDIPVGAAFLDITVTPVNDSIAEGTEYAVLNFANTSGGYILAGPALATVEIIDDESPSLPVVKLTQLDNVADEAGPDTATLRLERNGSTTANLTVNLTPTGTATNGIDYTLPSTVIIPAGSASATFILTPIDDLLQEGTETAIITIATNAAYARDTLSNSQTVTIYDDDLPTASVAATDSNLTETPGNPGVFTITRTGGNPYQALTVDYALAGRAIHGADYRRLDGRAVIPAGASATTVEIYPIDDSVSEGTQDIILLLRSTTTYAIGGTGTATMSITDNDEPQVYVKLTASGVTEPASGSITAITYQIIRPVSGSAITVNYAISGTATSGVDFTALPGTIAFAAGDTTKTINVSALADSEFEDTESVTLTLLLGTGYSLMTSQNPSATGFIVDGNQPTVDVSVADSGSTLTTHGSETSTNLRFIFSRDVSTTSNLVVNYTMTGTATEGVDYTGTTGSITIPSGATSAYLAITPVDDTIPEFKQPGRSS